MLLESEYPYIEDYIKHEYSKYDVSNPEVFRKYLIPDSHPIKIKLDKLFEGVKDSNKVKGLLDKCYDEPLSMRDIKVLKESDEKCILKIEDPAFYMKGAREKMVGRGGPYIGYWQIQGFYRVPMREILQDWITICGLQNEIDFPKKYYYHIPTYPEEINPINYMSLAEGKELMTPEKTKETLAKMKSLEPKRYDRLNRSAKTLRKMQVCDSHPRNFQLEQNGETYAVIDTEPQGFISFFKRTTYNLLKY